MRLRVKTSARFHGGRVGNFYLLGRGASEGTIVLQDGNILFAASIFDVEKID